MNKPKTPKSSQYLDVYLGALKEPWGAYCAALGKKPGAAIKEAIEQQLAKAEKAPEAKTYQQTGEAPDGEVKVRFEILLTPSEKAAIQERAELERCSQRRWVVDAIRAGLTREPQFGMKEIEALGESSDCARSSTRTRIKLAGPFVPALKGGTSNDQESYRRHH
jgi:hypothetical protein